MRFPIAPPFATTPRVPFARRFAVVARVAVLVGAVSVLGCSEDPTPPPTGDDPAALFEGVLDPGSATFLLSRVATSEPGMDIVLVGSHLVTDPNSDIVSLDVAIRNLSERAIDGSVAISLSDFRPAGAEVLNAEPLDADRIHWGFDYASTFGEDGTLGPNETSAPRSWRFRAPGGASLSFSAVANFGSAAGAVLGGSVFNDLNGNGVWEDREDPFFGGITVTRPDGTVVRTEVTERGRYRLPVRGAGLYLIAYNPPDLDCVCETRVTTPNPLEVLLVPGPDGQPRDYLDANFGVHIDRGEEGDVVPIVLTDRSPDEIQRDHYRLGDFGLRGGVLWMRVGFSGCSPDHPFPLYMTGGFMESDPVQVRIVLGHDDRGEECDAAFERTLMFDLSPLRDAYERAYGHPGTVRLRFVGPDGQDHELRYVWGSPVP